jgi:Domain of unknown function (DUF1996)
MVQKTVSRFAASLAVMFTFTTFAAFGCSQDVAPEDTTDVDTAEQSLAGKHRGHRHAADGGVAEAAGSAAPHDSHQITVNDGANAAGSGAVDPAMHADHPAASGGGDTNAVPSDAMDPVMHAEHTAPAAGDANAAPSGAMDPAMHDGHTPAASGDTTAGTYIDMNALIEGDPGSSTLDLGPTSEKPAVGDGVGAFRTVCDLARMAKDDPIVFPGQPGASHLHSFFGNAGANANSTQDSIRNSGNSTCRGGIANRSSYWVPSLIDAQGKPVEPIRIDVYYKSGYNGIAPEDVQPFPSGLRVIAGSAKASAAQEHSYWDCHGDYIGHPGSIPQCSSEADALNMVVEFPQCWDGKNLDSADHKSHMAYTEDGKCPSTHPVPIPAISFNVLYPVRNVTGWRLASDMYETSKPGGFSAHGDWFEGWDPDISKTFIKNCVNAGVDCHSHLLGDGRQIL